MKEFVIVTDSTSDLPPSVANELNLLVLPLKFKIDDKEYVNYLDERELSSKDFYDFVRNGAKPTTSQINPDEYVSALKPHLDQGKDILILAFSSALSGTYNSARIASEMLKDEYHNQNILLVDTKSASLGEGLLVYLVAKKAKEVKDIFELEKYALSLIPQIAHWFTVQDIDHLIRGGRVSKVAGFVAKLANIKPIMHADNEGKLVPRYKAIGMKRAIKSLFEEMKKSALPVKQTVFIGHGDDLDSANSLSDLIKSEYPDSEVLIHTIGPVIGSHTGQGVLALFYLSQNR